MLTFPTGLCPTAGGFAPNAKTLGGGQSLSGFEQVVSSVNGHWQASFKFPLNRKARILALRGFILSMEGRSNTVELPAFDLDRGPFTPASAASPIGDVLAATFLQDAAKSPIGTVYAATFFQEWKGLADTQYRFSEIEGLSGTAAVRSAGGVRLTVSGGTVSNGMYVECGGERRKLSNVTPAGTGIYDATVSPGFSLSPSPLERSFITGTVTVTSAATVTLSVIGGEPVTGMYVDCAGAVRRLSNVQRVSFGQYTASVTPGFTLVPGSKTAPAATLSANAALNASSISVLMSAGDEPSIGQLLSISTRLYVAKTVSGSNPYTLGIWPPLRAAALSGATVDFANPVCEMRFATDGEGADALKSMDLMKFGSVTLNFDEAAVT